jgi:hypothetical protein
MIEIAWEGLTIALRSDTKSSLKAATFSTFSQALSHRKQSG